MYRTMLKLDIKVNFKLPVDKKQHCGNVLYIWALIINVPILFECDYNNIILQVKEKKNLVNILTQTSRK